MITNIEIIGQTPTPEKSNLYRWTETDGTTWEEYWQSLPGGGLIQTRKVA